MAVHSLFHSTTCTDNVQVMNYSGEARLLEQIVSQIALARSSRWVASPVIYSKLIDPVFVGATSAAHRDL